MRSLLLVFTLGLLLWSDCDAVHNAVVPIRDIFFTQDSISCKFSNGGDLNQFIGQARANPGLLKNLPPMEVYNWKGHLYSKNNRRLYVFRELEKLGVVHNVNVRVMGTVNSLTKNMLGHPYTAKHDKSTQIRVRGCKKGNRDSVKSFIDALLRFME